nr:MAG TPA: hypothetical protein [Caudoviricetes sp.]
MKVCRLEVGFMDDKTVSKVKYCWMYKKNMQSLTK